MAPSQFTVAVLPLGNISEYQIELTEFVLQAVLGVKTLVLPAAKIPLSCLNAKTDRYSTDKLLDYLFFQLPENAQRIMGVTEANLETDDGHTSLGSAQPFDRVACYQVPPSEENTSQLGESFHLIIHEFLHTLGMHHCAEKNCVLHFIEFGMEICDRCDRWLKRELSISPHSAEERFSLAESFYRYKPASSDCGISRSRQARTAQFALSPQSEQRPTKTGTV